jgi:hypothetical protein
MAERSENVTEEQKELTDDEIDNEQVSNLPDREEMSIISTMPPTIGDDVNLFPYDPPVKQV